MDQLTYYFDRTFGQTLPRTLDRLRGTPFQVRHPKGEGFHQKTPDDEWLAIAGERRWVVITQDYKFHRPGFEHEMAAIREHSVQCFYFPCADETVWETVCTFARFHKKIELEVRGAGGCFIRSLSKSGKIKVIYES
ncbi:hypothetical protein [Marinovum algicola]|uniref:PIN-like domain-containing protein n=1 Tax=Marinovum TaxID=367771 RepID=UPI0032EFCCD7